ncbi:rhodanese-like domain-containing protein [Sulfurimonas sp.]|uniref:rhodanese-like domain-containing protein n=1 Tax=Sulfurimonas sp. TaxID=2022749 RepID=UPI00356357C7
MKKIILIFCICLTGVLADTKHDEYLKSFSYEERKAMKIGKVELSVLLEEKKAQLVDIRFKEEYEAWHMPASINIPLNELPMRLNELDKSKTIVTACPHKDRAIMARTFLKLKGYDARYLKDGLIGLAEYWRGDNAREFIEEYKK